MIPFDFFDPLAVVGASPLTGSFELEGGFAFGMVVRAGITNSVSMETGINQIQRRFQFTLINDTAGYEEGDRIRYIGYEVPVLVLVYIRLGERTWMNNALGLSIDLYPSDAVRLVDQGRAYLFRKNWVQGGAVGNIGFEYRTENSGYFYLGATYHRPFGDMAVGELTWSSPQEIPYSIRTGLGGSYLTVDLRYFFHERPERTRGR